MGPMQEEKTFPNANEMRKNDSYVRPSFLYRLARFVFRYFPLPGILRFTLRKWCLRLFLGEGQINFSRWYRKYGVLGNHEKEMVSERIGAFSHQPLISLMTVGKGEEGFWEETAKSLIVQLYPQWEWNIFVQNQKSDSSIDRFKQLSSLDPRIHVSFYEPQHNIKDYTFLLNRCLDLSHGAFLSVLMAGDSLSVECLYKIAHEIVHFPETKLIYCDEDRIDRHGKHYSPCFKPDWCPHLLHSTNYVGNFVFFERNRLRLVEGFREEFDGVEIYDLLLRFSYGIDSREIRHIPRILVHSRNHPRIAPTDSGAKAVRKAIEKQGIPATVEPLPGKIAYRIRPILEHSPKVTIIIPTRDGYRWLKPCVEGILEKTSYPDFEMIVVDNQSSDKRTLEFLDDMAARGSIRLFSYDQPFNFSAINNFGASKAKGEILCLLNDDIEVISPDWLSEMVGWAAMKGVGAVGAKLYYPDGRIQHGGVVLGPKGGFHAFRFFSSHAKGYCDRLMVLQNYSAVTGACLAVRKDLFDSVGGLDEKYFPVAFNDIDFCLKLLQKGYKNIWTPFAELLHKESVSRGHDDSPEKERRFLKEFEEFKARWGEIMNDDPAYNPNLTLAIEDFSLTSHPRERALLFSHDKFVNEGKG